MKRIDLITSEDLATVRPALELYQKYSLLSGKAGNPKLFTLSYIFGLNAVQQLMKKYKTLKNKKSQDECSTKTTMIITFLEDAKNKQLKRIERKSSNRSLLNSRPNENDKTFMEVLDDDDKARLFLNRWCVDQLDRVESIIKGGFIDISTADTLLDLSTALQASIDMYPAELTDKDQSKTKRNDLDEADKVVKDSELYEEKLRQAEYALNGTESKENELKESEDEKMEDLTQNQLERKIQWCKFCISRICYDINSGKDPNDDMTLSLGATQKEQVKISDEEVQKVIESIMNTRDDFKNDSDDSEDDSDKYYYDSEEEEYVKKGEFDSQFPKPPIEDGANKDGEEKERPVLDRNIQPKAKVQEEIQNTAVEISPASIVASQSAEKRKTAPENPPDLKSLEKRLDNSGPLESAKKCCKFAISAIQYEDVETALDELKEATTLLENFKTKIKG